MFVLDYRDGGGTKFLRNVSTTYQPTQHPVPKDLWLL